MWLSSREGVCHSLTWFLFKLPTSTPSFFVLPSFRFAGRPGDYVYVFGDYRMEEVRLVVYISGCLYKYVQ